MRHPYVKWKYLNQTDKDNPANRYVFTITEKGELPFFSDGKQISKRVIFPEGTRIVGVPVAADIQADGINGIGQGVLLREQDGFFIIPRRMVRDFSRQADIPVTEEKVVIDETKINDAKVKQLTGFNSKQLIAIAVVGLLTYAIFK